MLFFLFVFFPMLMLKVFAFVLAAGFACAVIGAFLAMLSTVEGWLLVGAISLFFIFSDKSFLVLGVFVAIGLALQSLEKEGA